MKICIFRYHGTHHKVTIKETTSLSQKKNKIHNFLQNKQTNKTIIFSKNKKHTHEYKKKNKKQKQKKKHKKKKKNKQKMVLFLLSFSTFHSSPYSVTEYTAYTHHTHTMPASYGAEDTKYIQSKNIHYLLDDLCKYDLKTPPSRTQHTAMFCTQF